MSPNLVNYFLVNYSRNEQPSVAPANTTTPAEIGFTANFVANGAFAGPPVIRFFDRGFQLGNTIQGPQARLSENLQFQDSLSWIVGNHRFKFGGDATRYKQGQDFLFVNQGLFTYSGLFGGNTTGDDFADFLIGNSPIAIQFGAAGRRDYRQSAFAGFAQDTWRVTNNLTLSLGVRYEFTSPITDTLDRVAYYRPGATSQLLASGQLFTADGQQIVVQGGNLPRGLLFQFAYTFSKSFNDADTQRGQLDLLDRSAGWALSNEDIPHRFVGSVIYELPFSRNTSGFANRLLHGWALNGIYTYQSGDLFSVGNPIDIDGTGGAILNFADLGSNQFTTLDPRTNNLQAFNPGAFSIADCGANFQLCGGVGRRGTSGRNQFRLDNPINNLDLALIKKARLWGERSNLELRFEVFNVLNRAQFTTVDLNLNSANFGEFTDTRESRSVQLGARINF